MPWLGAIGAAVASYVGVTVAAASLTAMAVGGIVVGAAVGALYSAVTGGSVWKGALFGAIGGAVAGAGAFAVGGAMAGGSGTVTYGATSTQTLGSGMGTTSGMLSSGATSASGGSLFTAQGLSSVSAVGTMGAAFLKGGSTPDPGDLVDQKNKDRDAQLAMNEDNNKTALERARISAEASMGAASAASERATGDREESARQFDERIAFDKQQYTEKRDYDRSGKDRFEEGIKDASEFVKGEKDTANVVQTRRQRMDLPSPIWSREKNPTPNQQPAQPTSILQGAA